LCIFKILFLILKKKQYLLFFSFLVTLLFFFFQLDGFFFFIVQRIKCEILVKWVLPFKNYHYLFVIFILFYYGHFLLFHHVRECGNGRRGGNKGRVLKFTRKWIYIQDLAKWLESKSGNEKNAWANVVSKINWMKGQKNEKKIKKLMKKS